MFGRQAKLPVDLVHGSTPTEPQPQHEYARQLQKILQGALPSCSGKHGDGNGENEGGLQSEGPWEPGDLVWLHTPVVPKGKPRKLHCPWTGPFRVVKGFLRSRTESLIYDEMQHGDVRGWSYTLIA